MCQDCSSSHLFLERGNLAVSLCTGKYRPGSRQRCNDTTINILIVFKDTRGVVLQMAGFFVVVLIKARNEDVREIRYATTSDPDGVQRRVFARS